MSYAEHGPRIFLVGRPSCGAPLTYGDYVLPKKRLEGRLKLYNSCTDIRAWSPNISESSRYFRELNEHDPAAGRAIPFDVVMDNMIGLTAQAQNELCVVQRELQKYKSLKLTPEQQTYLENFDKAIERSETAEMKIKPIIRPILREERGLFNANKLASLRHFDTYLSIYFYPDRRFRYDGGIGSSLLSNTLSLRRNLNPSLENRARLMLRVPPYESLNEATRERNERANICIEYVDVSSQAVQDVCEAGVQTDGCKNSDDYDKRSNIDSSSSQYYESSESTSTSESELGVNSDPAVCEKTHKRVIIQKDSEIIVLKNELGMKEDELDELRELNRHLQTLMKEKDDHADILRHNLNTLQEKLKVANDKRNDEMEDFSAKLAAAECLVDQLRAELARKCQLCYFQSQEVQKLREQVKEAELLSIENESLTQKVREMEYLSKEAESCGIALEQVKNERRERDILQKQYHEQSCTLADREDEIKRLLTLIKQMSVAADTREVEMNDVVAGLRGEIQTKSDKISQCEMQLVCMEREVGNLTNMLKSSLNNLDEAKIAYEGICGHTKCEHDTCLDVQSALSALKVFIAEVEECKLERRNRPREIDNLRACVACYSQECASEIANADFDTGRGSIQPAAGIAEDVSTSSNSGDCRSSKELVNVQIQSDDVDSTATFSEVGSEKVELNGVISYEEIDRALAMHIKRSIDKIHEISTVLQGAGDQHVQIVKEFTKQQRELQRKDLEITELRQQVAEHVLRRGEGDCMIQEQLRKRMAEKEKALEAINKRDTEIEKLREHLIALESELSSHRVERDTLKIENADLLNARSVLSRENDEQNEKLRAQREQMCELMQQMEELKRTIGVLKEETDNVDSMRKKLIDLQMQNNDLTNKLIQANEAVSKNAEIIAELRSKDEQSRVALTHNSLKYDAVIRRKHGDIAKLREENQSLRDQLREAGIKLAHSGDTISLLKRKSDNIAAISALQANLSGLDADKERLLAKVDYLRGEITDCRSATANVEMELQALSHRNETLKTDIETVRSTSDQLVLCAEEGTIKRSLREALYALPRRIYERIVRLRTEIEEQDESKTEDKTFGLREIKLYEDKSCQQDAELGEMGTRDKLDPFVREAGCDSENIADKLRILEQQYEEKQREIKNLIDDVKLRDYEIKNLQECITHLLREKNDLQDKIKRQVKEYQSKLMILKKKYDGSLNAFRKRHNENVERLQARFEDIMKVEKGPFDADSWLQLATLSVILSQSLNLKELTELHNRINILSSHAAENDESDIAHTEAGNHRGGRSNPEEHRFRNKFTLHKQYTSKSKTSLNRRTSNKGSAAKIRSAESKEKVVVTELYSRDLRLKQKRTIPDDGKKHRTESAGVPFKPTTDRTLDRQREKFIYQCSVHHKLNSTR